MLLGYLYGCTGHAGVVPLQALTSVITDPLGTPLFSVRMAAAGLPVTAGINFIEEVYGDSITDQVVTPPGGRPPMSLLQMAGLLAGVAVLAAVAAAVSVAAWKRRAIAQQTQTTPRLPLAHNASSASTKAGLTDIELAGHSANSTQLHDEPLNPFYESETSSLLFQQHFSGRVEGNQQDSADRLDHDLGATSPNPFWEDSCNVRYGQPGSRKGSSDSSGASVRVSHVEYDIAQRELTLKKVQAASQPRQPNQAWEINPDQIQICQHPRGGLWQLGSGSFGVVCSLFTLQQLCMYMCLKRQYRAFARADGCTARCPGVCVHLSFM